MNSWKRRIAALGLVVLLGVAMASCGGGSSSSSGSTAESASTSEGSSETSSSETSESSSESESGESNDAKAYLAKWFKGTFELPKVTPVTPPRGKNVWVVTVGQLAVSSQLVAKAFTAEGPKMGWNVTVFDGKFEPSRWLEGVRSGVAANADAIVTYAIDCPSIASALKEAKAANIPVINIQGVDCNAEGGQQLFAYDVTYAPGNSSMETWAHYLGNAQGAWVAAERPEGKILSVAETDIRITAAMGEGFKETIEKYCPGCEIVEEIELVGTEIGPELQNKIEQSLLRHPEVDVVYGNYDDIVVGSVAPAIRNAGRQGQIALIGCEGQKPNIEMIYEGTEAAGAGISNSFEGYSALDATIRILAGQKPLGHTGDGAQVYDADHNLPKKGEFYEPKNLDYKGTYRKAWGLE